MIVTDRDFRRIPLTNVLGIYCRNVKVDDGKLNCLLQYPKGKIMVLGWLVLLEIFKKLHNL